VDSPFHPGGGLVSPLKPGEEPLERRAIISGIGQSDVGRRLGRSELDLTIEAAVAAIADAGLTRDDIDGLSTYPGMGAGTAGFAGPTSPEVQDAMGLSLNWHDGGGEGAGQMRAVHTAALAVAAGLARHVLVYRTVTEGSAQGTGGRQGIGGAGSGGGGGGVPRFGSFMQWSLPFGAVSAANWLAMVAQRRVHEFGLTRQQLGAIAINNRANAALNPKAIYTDPMTMDDYLAARMITTPLCLFDCDAPCDGSTVVIVSHRDFAPDLDHPAVQINALGTALRGRPSWDQFDDMTTMAARDAGASMWERTELTPPDVDTAQLYDGFSILAVTWLEALGFCGRGESGPFIEGGTNIARDGLLPLNTNGGQLSGGRLHGFGLIHEACVQLRGEGGERQVVRPGGRPAEVAAVANGGGPIAGTMLLTRGVTS
jgi:acetyl-CoA acetyltransferase